MTTTAPLNLVIGLPKDRSVSAASAADAFGPAIPKGNWRSLLALRRPHAHQAHADPGDSIETQDPWGGADECFDASSEQDEDEDRNAERPSGAQDADEEELRSKQKEEEKASRYQTGWTTCMSVWWEDASLALDSGSSSTTRPAFLQRTTSNDSAIRSALAVASETPSNGIRKRGSVSSLRGRSLAAGSPLSRTVEMDSVEDAGTPRQKRRKVHVVGSTAGHRVALGFQDGSVWIMKSGKRPKERPENGDAPASAHLLSPRSKADASPSQRRGSASGSTSPGHGRLRSVSATTQASTPSQQPRPRVPSITGFAPEPSSATEISVADVSMMNPGGNSPPSLDWDSSSLASSSVASGAQPLEKKDSKQGKQTLIGSLLGGREKGEGSPTPGASTPLPSAEAMLEAQYHAGEQQPGLIAGAVGKLFTGTHQDEHHHHHSAHAQTSTHATQVATSPHRSHNRQNALSLAAPAPLMDRSRSPRTVPPQIDDRVEGMQNKSQMTGSTINGQCVEIEVSRPEETMGLEHLDPLLRLTTSDPSPVVATRAVELVRDTLLFVLQEDGQVSTWSMESGDLRSSLDLRRSDAYPEISKAASSDHSANGDSGAGGFLNMQAHLASITALRSRASSPAPGSRVGSRRGSHSSVGAPSIQGKTRPASCVQCRFTDMSAHAYRDKAYLLLVNQANRQAVIVREDGELKIVDVASLPVGSDSCCTALDSSIGVLRMMTLNENAQLLNRSVRLDVEEESKDPSKLRVTQQQPPEAKDEWTALQHIRIEVEGAKLEAKGIAAWESLLLAWCGEGIGVSCSCE